MGGNGINGKYPSNGVANTPPTGGTQTGGGTTSTLPTSGGTGTNGSFGLGGNGNSDWGSAGGGGYYGGGGGGWTGYSVDSGAGGSSFISGRTGCDAISSTSTNGAITHTGQAVHYSGLKFVNTVMRAGNEVMPTQDGSSTRTGNAGNGYAKITWVGQQPGPEVKDNVYLEDFNSWANYTTTATTASVANGILTLKSSSADPMVFMNQVTSFNPAEYRYIEVKYRTSSSAGSMEFFMIENPSNQTYAISQPLVCNGQWNILTIDLWSNSSVKGRNPITGWRWDWCSANNATMEVDYIMIKK